MAMVLLERKLKQEAVPGEWTVTSAGTWARDGFAASKHGRDIMSEWGMDLEPHQSRVINREILSGADLILTMETGHQEALRAEFPDYAGKIFLLSEMVGFRADIRDPYGGIKEEYLDTARELESYINEGFEKIVQLARANAVDS